MKKRAVIIWMKYLEKDELAEFRKTIRGKEKEKKLFNFLKKYYPIFDHEDLDDDSLALKAVFGAKATNLKSIHNKASDLKLLLVEFIHKKALEHHPFEKERLLALELQRRKESKAALQSMQKAKKMIEEPISPWLYLERMRLAYNSYFAPSFDKFSPAAKDILEACRQDLLLGHRLLSEILSLEIASRNLILGKQVQELDEASEDNPLLLVLQKLRQLYRSNKKADFQSAKQQLESCHPHQTEHDIITTWLLNFALIQIQQQQDDAQYWKEEAFSLFKYGIEKKALLQNGLLSENHFVTAIMLACMLKQTDWGFHLAEKAPTLLAGENKNFHIQLAHARLEFAQANFIAVHDRLHSENYKNIADNLKVRTLLAKTYFELSLPNKEAIVDPENCIESLRSYLNRNEEITPENKKPYLNFINCYKALLQAKHKKNTLPDLIERISNTNGEELDNKEWLLKVASTLVDVPTK